MGVIVRRLGKRGVGQDKLIMLPDRTKPRPPVNTGTVKPK